jgi:hypothetical protein
MLMSTGRVGGLLLLTVLWLAACGNAAPASLTDVIAPDAERPTFLYFYTEN